MPPAPAMTRARWAVLAAGLPVVLALIAWTGYVWVHGTVIYLAGLQLPVHRGRAGA
jgi:hypothetical protein